jgi:hypothetical protein
MAYSLTQRTKDALSRELIEPNLVLSIEGYPEKLAVRIANQTITYDIDGLTYDMPGLTYDGLVQRTDVSDLISLTGTTTSISQQLDPDKGAASSTQTLTLKLIDRNEQITQLASPGVVLNDPLYTDCKLYFGLFTTSFPEDYIEVFNGKIMSINPSVGTIDFVITHPDDLKRSSIFEKAEAILTQKLNFDSVTIQDLFYQKRSDVSGSVSIEYTSAAIGDNAIVAVTGNSISVQIDTAFTKAKTLKKKIENDEDANQLVSVKISGNANAVQAVVVPTILSSGTEIFLDDVTSFLSPVAPIFRTYARINDEIIEYTGIDLALSKLTGCTRQSLTSFGFTHEIGDTVSSFYKLGDNTISNSNPVDLALKIIMSGAEAVYTDQDSTSVNFVNGVGTIANSMFFPGVYLERDHNVTVGDFVDSTGPVPGNTFSDKQVEFVQDIDAGSYIVVNGVSLVDDMVGTYSVSFKSQYNILPDGGGALPSQVDIKNFNSIKTSYISRLIPYEFYLKDTVSTKDFINQQIFIPCGMYSVPRKGKISAGITAPPLYSADSKFLTLENVKDPEKLKLERSVNKNFYNAISYKYNPDSVEDKFLNKVVTVSADSSNRVGAPAKVLVIESEGIRPGIDTQDFIKRNSDSFLSRYRYGAEQIKMSVLLKDGFSIEVGDAVLFGGSAFTLPDTTNGNKSFVPRIMEVTNKEWNWKTGEVSLTMLDTTYSSEIRVGVFSPSSEIGSGSTTTTIKIEKSYGTGPLEKEKDKYSSYIGREILVHSEDWSIQGYTSITGFDPGNDSIMIVSPPLGFSPLAGYIIDVVQYNEVDALEGFYKNVHCFWGHQVDVVAGVSATQVTVAPGDIGKFFIGSVVRIHNDDYTIDSGVTGLKVTSISGNDILIEDCGFVPDNTMSIDLIGFSSDNGKPYVWL